MVIKIFSAYVEPLLKYINHPALLQEWKLNLDAAEYETIYMLTCINLLKKEINHYDSNLYWPTSINETIQWFPFIAIMEHTANIMKTTKGRIPSLIKACAMFELRLIGYK